MSVSSGLWLALALGAANVALAASVAAAVVVRDRRTARVAEEPPVSETGGGG